MEEAQIRITQCFEQNMLPSCAGCPAHRAQGGTCCFGDPKKFDMKDEECQSCHMRALCMALVKPN